MPLPKLKDLRKRRRALDLTQDMLAAAAGVTREMISMIENNHHYPRYDIADKIFSFLELKEYKTMKGGLTASKVCSTHMKDVKDYDSITAAKKLMKRYGFDQLPVMIRHPFFEEHSPLFAPKFQGFHPQIKTVRL